MKKTIMGLIAFSAVLTLTACSHKSTKVLIPLINQLHKLLKLKISKGKKIRKTML